MRRQFGDKGDSMTQQPWWDEASNDASGAGNGQFVPPQAAGAAGFAQGPQFPPPAQGFPPQGPQFNAWQYSADAAPQQAPEWVPAPKPGLIPLRPLTFGDVISASFKLLRTNLQVNLGTSVIVMLLSTLIMGGAMALMYFVAYNRLEMSSSYDSSTISAGNATLMIVVQLLATLFAMVGGGFLQAALSHSIARAAIGDKVTFGETWQRAFKRLPAVLVSLFVQALFGFLALVVVMAPIFILIVTTGGDLGQRDNAAMAVIVMIVSIILYVGLILFSQAIYVRLGFAPNVAVLEGSGGIASIKRSWQLTRGYFWRTFGIQIVVSFIIQNVLSIVIGGLYMLALIPLAILIPLGVAGTLDNSIVTVVMIVLLSILFLLLTVVTALSTIVQYGANVLIYLDLRFRKEGFNLKLQKTTEDIAAGIPVTDPFDADDEARRLGALAPAKQPAAPAGYPQPRMGYPQPGGMMPPQQAPGFPQQAPNFEQPTSGFQQPNDAWQQRSWDDGQGQNAQ